ncbi:MAG TPA: hypothetical protein VIH52_04295 [Candidatus Nanoarchaeia archaeon]
MKLIYALLCDQAFLSIERKVNIIGVFETINAPSFPVSHPKFTLVGSISPSKAKFRLAVDIVSENSVSILKEPQEREVSLPQNSQAKNFNFIIDVLNTVFPQMGNYLVKIFIDGKTIAELPLVVAKTDLVN